MSAIKEPSTLEPQPRHRSLKPRDGHTARCKGTRDHSPVRISRKDNEQRIDKHTIARPVTAFDDYHFNSYNTTRFGVEIPVNKNRLWEDAIDVLEANAVSKHAHRVHDSRPDKKVVDYVLPVTGEQLTRDTARKPPNRYHTRFFMFRGKRLDTTMIYYSYKKNEFEPYGRYKFMPEDPSIKPITGKMKLVGNTAAVCINQSLTASEYLDKDSLYDYRCPWYEKDFLYTDVDFGKDVPVTHLSMMGRTLRTGAFPLHQDEADEYGLNGKHTVRFVRERNAQYVTKFELQYRVHSSKKWISAGHFTGNNDRLTEHRVQFEQPITAQFFRIIPITYNGSPSMNFRFYTAATTLDATEDTQDAPRQTVTYQVSQPSTQHYYTGSRKQYGCQCSMCTAQHDHRSRRTADRSEYNIKNIDKFTNVDSD